MKKLLLISLLPFLALSQTLRFESPNDNNRDQKYNNMVPVQNNDTLYVTMYAKGWEPTRVFQVEAFKKPLPSVKFTDFDSAGHYVLKFYVSTVDRQTGNLYFGHQTLPLVSLDKPPVGIMDEMLEGVENGFTYYDINGGLVVRPVGLVIRSDGRKILYSE